MTYIPVPEIVRRRPRRSVRFIAHVHSHTDFRRAEFRRVAARFEGRRVGQRCRHSTGADGGATTGRLLVAGYTGRWFYFSVTEGFEDNLQKN